MPDAERLIDRLAGHVSEPFRKEEVLAAARRLSPPFLLREVVAESGLPGYTVHRKLTMLVKQGVLRRIKARMTYPQMGGRLRIFRPGGKQRSVYLYSWAQEA